MKRSEVAKLVTVVWAAEGYNREPGDADVELWFAFASEGKWESYDAALRAYVVYRSAHPNFPLRPGHITQTLEEVRRASSASFEDVIQHVPDHVRDAEDFDTAYLQWIKGEAAKHRSERMDRFVAGETPTLRAIEA